MASVRGVASCSSPLLHPAHLLSLHPSLPIEFTNMMRFLRALVSAALVPLASSAVVPRQISINYDAVIVGGGPAGLSALSGLARVRRNILLIDSGEYRNGPTRHMHDVVGSDGTCLTSPLGHANELMLTVWSRCHSSLLPLGCSRANIALRDCHYDQRYCDRNRAR
jgi:hypothetical protein